MISLAVKYRPKTFEDVVCQDSVKTILMNQIQTGEFKQGYLFTGSAGCGKTTSARIFANEINKGKGKPIEIDGASNNGVDNIRNIIDDCRMKSLDSKYKVYIIDEVHMLSIGAFNALLKVLEEPPKGVIFILCTTDPHKIPATILSRVQRFQFKRIPQNEVVKRLQYVLQQEGKITYDMEALQYIAKLADGGMRDALMKLDTVLGYTTEITMEAVLDCLGITNYDYLFKIVSSIIKQDATTPMQLIDDLYKQGKDLKLFVKDLSKFILDLCKLELTQDINTTMIPPELKTKCTQLLCKCDLDLLVDIMDAVNKLMDKIKYEQNPKSLIESELIILCLG